MWVISFVLLVSVCESPELIDLRFLFANIVFFCRQYFIVSFLFWWVFGGGYAFLVLVESI